MIEKTMHILAVPDLATSTSYYRDVLGFSIHEVGDPGWRIYRMGACTIMAGECRDALPPAKLGDHSYFGYFHLTDIEAYHRLVVDRGAELTKPLRDEPWGMREFGVRTADGHRIMFGQSR